MNLFQQAMYRGRPQPHQNAAMTGDDIRNTMCEQGIVGVKATALVHSGKWRKHKYLYIDANGKYVYPEDLQKSSGSKDRIAIDTNENIQKKKQNISEQQLPSSLRFNRNMTKDEMTKTKYAVKSKGVNSSVKDTDEAKTLKKRSETKEGIVNREMESKTGKLAKKAAKQVEDERRKSGTNDAYDVFQMLSRQNAKIRKRKSEKKAAEQQRKSAHAGYEIDKKIFPDGGSTEELERQKKKTKARKSASKRFNENDQSIKRSSSGSSQRKEYEQINSAHRMSTDMRDTYKKVGSKTLLNTHYYDQSGEIDRQKRKTALRKRSKK